MENCEADNIMKQNYKYYVEYCKLCEANTILKNQLNSLSKEKNVLKNEIQKTEVLINKNKIRLNAKKRNWKIKWL